MEREFTKEDFKKFAKEHITRKGIDELLAYLESTDFFEAPASTRPEYHSCYEGGLCDHSIKVYKRLMKTYPGSESAAIVSLFHDVCKANCYTVEMRNSKNKAGQWVKVPFYVFKQLLPITHGPKSAYLVERHMRLTDEEACAIANHMNGFSEDQKTAGAAYEMYPLALELSVADQRACHYDEKNRD